VGVTRPLALTRDEAELLDQCLLEYVQRNQPLAFDVRAVRLAHALAQAWGMKTWPQRPDSGIATEDYARWRDAAGP
jgi:hypothetical protein